ncbi:MAG: NAD(P)/FAD-dependent oxidoreductase [Dehalococcoidia bacterium]
MTQTAETTSQASGDVQRFDAVIVGAGLAGLYMLHRLRGLGFSARVIEAGDGVGGTWYWNRYPGARCDIESLEYSYSFSEELQQEWHWSERFASQPEILRYIEHVADRFDLRRDVQFKTRVTSARWNDEARQWRIETDRGDVLDARFCIMATGMLSAPQDPDFAGLDTFAGDWYHTGRWPHEGVDFTGQRVAVIGTGSSAIQSIPIIAQQSAHLTVFQRTPNFVIPARNHPMDPEYERSIKDRYAEVREIERYSRAGTTAPRPERGVLESSPEEREREFRARWERGGLGFTGAFNDLLMSREANEFAAEFVRERIREVVHDPATAELLSPRSYPIGTKRVCIDTGYFETFNRENVSLVDIRSAPILEITPKGIRTTEGEYEVDAIVFAIGFDAMTGTLLRVDIRGEGGQSLADAWADGPVSYLGLCVSGFPNLFTITGPGSPSVLSNMIVSIEQHVDWIADCLEYLRAQGVEVIDADEEAQAEWVEHVAEVGNMTLYPSGYSWYVGANIEGKPRVFMPYIGGVGAYRKRCEQIAANGYTGFALTASTAVAEA